MVYRGTSGGLFGGVWGGPKKGGKDAFPIVSVVVVVYVGPFNNNTGLGGQKYPPRDPSRPVKVRGRVGMGDFRA